MASRFVIVGQTRSIVTELLMLKPKMSGDDICKSSAADQTLLDLDHMHGTSYLVLLLCRHVSLQCTTGPCAHALHFRTADSSPAGHGKSSRSPSLWHARREHSTRLVTILCSSSGGGGSGGGSDGGNGHHSATFTHCPDSPSNLVWRLAPPPTDATSIDCSWQTIGVPPTMRHLQSRPNHTKQSTKDPQKSFRRCCGRSKRTKIR